MEHLITVRGVGNTTISPDLTVILLTIEEENKNYDKAVAGAAKRINQLEEAMSKAGFPSGTVKTVRYNVRMKYDYPRDKHGNMKKEFSAYVCVHNLKIEFVCNPETLAKAIDAIMLCDASLEFNISFTVKNQEAVNEQLLKSAGESAKRKAEILCEAAGGKLGQLRTIDYNWNEINIFSPTSFTQQNTDTLCYMAAPSIPSVEVQPEDIKLSDSATFVWEIE